MINSLIASLFVYKIAVLPTIPETLVLKIEVMFNKFLWGGHKPKVLQSVISSGGRGLTYLRWKDESIMVTWIDILQEITNTINV